MGFLKFLAWLATNAIALAVAAWLFDGIGFQEGPDWQDKIWPLLFVALILGIVNSFVSPILKFLSIPFIILTLGLFLLVINAGLLLLTGWVADKLDIGFEVSGFWPAVGGAIVITVVTWIVDGLIGEAR